MNLRTTLEECRSIDKPLPASLPKAPTGIAGFDEITLGGLPRGRPTLVCGPAGCGKTFLAGSASQWKHSKGE